MTPTQAGLYTIGVLLALLVNGLRRGWRGFRTLFGCTHEEMIRERRADGGLDERCSRCGYVATLVAPVGQPRPKGEM